jgi:hypothetical protein
MMSVEEGLELKVWPGDLIMETREVTGQSWPGDLWEFDRGTWPGDLYLEASEITYDLVETTYIISNDPNQPQGH